MRLFFGILILCFFVVFFQVSLVDVFQIGEYKPDLRALLIFLVALRMGPVWGVWTGFFVGLSLDSFTEYMGYQAFVGSLMGYSVGLIEERVLYFKRHSYLFLFFGFCWILNLLECFLIQGFYEISFIDQIFGLLPHVLLSFCFGLPLIYLFYPKDRLVAEDGN